MLRSIGADHLIDYTCEDWYDVILDMVYSSSFSHCVNSLADDGTYLMANTGPLRMLRGLWLSWWSKKKFICAMAGETITDLNHLAALIASGKIKPVVDKTYPLERTAEAHAYVEAGNKKGCIVISMH
jgi:NADPH:quinone reductase-like Zn-dependent oxidoreductase